MLLTLAPAAAGASANTSSRAQEHCSISITGQKASGEFITTMPSCARTASEARALDAGATQQSGDVGVLSILAIHYKGSNFTGASLTVNGSNCNGGWVNMSGANATYNNSIVSTRNQLCGRTAHYDLFNKVNFIENHYSSEVNHASVCCISSVSYNT